jgi:hypothetical protein
MLGIPAYRRYRRIDWSTPSILPLYKHSAYRHIGISVCGYRYGQYINRFLGYREENLGNSLPYQALGISAYRHIDDIFIYADMPICRCLAERIVNNDESSAPLPILSAPLRAARHIGISAYHYAIRVQSWREYRYARYAGTPVCRYVCRRIDVLTYQYV